MDCVCVLSRSVMSDSFRPHGLTRLLSPWNSPGKNTGVGCHAFFKRIFVTQGSNPGLPHCRWVLYYLSLQGTPARFLCPWDSLSKNSGERNHSLLQGIFTTKGSSQGLLHFRRILYQLSHKESPLLKFKPL